MDPARLLDGLDAEQIAAVTAPEQPLAIIASAGSGKTTVLTRRIAHRIATGSADAGHVLALTFTRDAANELHRRLRRFDLRTRIEAGTFHAVALRILRDRAEARHERMPNVATDRFRLVADTLANVGLRVDPFGAQTDIDWARARRITPERYATMSRRAARRSTIPAARFAEVLAAFEQHKRRRGVIDFDDILERTLAAADDPLTAQIVGWRFRHFFVDEAQDLNPLQFAVLESWRQGRPDLCLVGDPRQAIYGWNGADPTLLGEVERTVAGITVRHLSTNYRCSPQVLRAGQAALDAAGIEDLSRPARGDGPSVGAVTCRDERDEAQRVVALVREARGASDATGVAVLARTNEQLAPLAAALTAAGLRVSTASARTPLERIVGEVARLSRERMAAWVVDAQEHEDPLRRRVAVEVDRYLTADERSALRPWLERERVFEDLEPAADSDVTVATFHAAKGREWDAVVIAGANEGLVPHASATSVAQLGEEARLFYVAMTRARRSLVLTTTEQRRQSRAVPSRWLQAVLDTTLADRPAPPPVRRSAPLDPLAAWKRWRAQVARGALCSEVQICSDRVLADLAARPPRSNEELADALGITPTAAARLPALPSA